MASSLLVDPDRLPEPPRALPLWLGMPFGAWLALLARNGFRVRPGRWPAALAVTLVSPGNSLLLLLQHGLLAARGAKPPAAPLLIVGHPRSGTTLLHEYLALDPRHHAPTGYDCFLPCHFLLSRRWLRPLLERVTPKSRPTDAMAFSLESPQEDEFALHLLGASPLNDILAFPERGFRASQARVDAGGETAERRLLSRLKRFLAGVGLGREGRMALKSPMHGTKLSVLAKGFPGLKVVHIVRDPRAVLPSFLRTTLVLQRMMALGRIGEKADEEWVADYLWYFERFERERQALAAGNLVEIRYEELVARPLDTLEGVYRSLDLGDFGPTRRALEARLAATSGYRASGRTLDPAAEAFIETRCQAVMQRYGYAAG